MSRTQSRFDTAVETFQNSSGMTKAEAEVYVSRSLDGLSRSDTAQRFNKSESTVDTQFQNAKEKAQLPHIKEVVRISERNSGTDEGQAWEVRFENGALLRYVWNHEQDEIVESVNRADDPVSTYKQFGVGGSEDELAEYALESIAEYTQSYRDYPKACRDDWPPVFEALTAYGA